MDYNIKAKPTQYNGRLYRSRLEAKWASFFDSLNWKHEYEPFDLNGWSPDFLINGILLVEIKPFTTYKEFVDAGVIDKIIKSKSAILYKNVNPNTDFDSPAIYEKVHGDYRVAVLGLYPFQNDTYGMQIGWVLTTHEAYFEDPLSIITYDDGDTYGVTETMCSWINIFNPSQGGKLCWRYNISDHISFLWAKSSNEVMILKPKGGDAK